MLGPPKHPQHANERPCRESRTLDRCLATSQVAGSAIFGSDDYKETDSDFLFVAKGKTLDEAAANGVEVIAKTGGVGPVFDYARGGPQWGGAPPALVIGPPLAPVGGGITGLDAEETAVGTLRTAKSTLGIGYAKTSAGEDSLFGDGVRECRLTDVLVFSAVDLYL